MKNVLLTTTALVAFAGAAAAADVATTWTGEAWVEYNVDNGVISYFADSDLDITLSQELNNGAVASLALTSAIDWENGGGAVSFDPSWVAALETSYGTLSFGDIDNVNDGVFQEAGPMDGLVDTDEDGSGDDGDIPVYAGDFWNNDTTDYGQGHDFRIDASAGGIAIAFSTDTDESDGVFGLNLSGSFGAVDFMVLYNSNDGDTTTGVTASGAMGGVDFNLAYATGSYTEDTAMGGDFSYAVSSEVTVSAGVATFKDANGGAGNEGTYYNVGADYASGPIVASFDYDVDNNDVAVITASADYTMDVSAGTTVTVGVSYDDSLADEFGASVDLVHVAGDLSVYVGADIDENVYAGAVYDLGGGASAYGYYADGTDLGPEEWTNGTIIGLAMTF